MSYHMFNTKIAKKLGMVEAVLLHNIYFWIKKSKANNKHFYKGKYWTYNSAKAFSELFDYLSDRQISRALKSLVDDGYLIKDNFNTNPFDRTSWYALSDKYYDEFIGENGEANNCESNYQTKHTDIPKMENGKAENGKSYICTDINTYINKTDSKPDGKKNIKKSCVSIFSQALELYQPNQHFSSDDWAEWVEYKQARSKNLTILTFKKNLEQLKSFGNLAKEAIDNSISNNWVGLFKPQQNINQNQSNNTNRNFRGGYLEAKDKFANMSNPDYDDSAYDFSLLPSETCNNGS